MRVPSCGDMIRDRYRLDEVLGEGASAWVFKAFDLRAQRNVALKIAKPEGEGYSPETQRRFDREVRIIANLQDPHTVTLYGSGRTEAGHLFMVFEFVQGKDLAELIIERQRLLPYEVVHIVEQVLESLREAHQNGLLHRDIKPENVRVFATADDELAVKLLDFGIARPHDPDAQITRAGEIVGTPRYMSPEALMESNLTPAADIYSVGIMAMEMLFGRDALHGNDWSEQYERMLTGHVFIFEGMDAIPDELMDVIEKMTQQKPQQRYQTANAALRALREVRELLDEPIDTVDEHDPRYSGPLEAPASTSRTPVEPPERPQGVPVVYVAVVAVLVAVLTAGIFLWAMSREEAAAVPRIPRAVLASKAPSSKPAPAAAEPAEPAPEPERELPSGCGTEPGFASLVEQKRTVSLNTYTWRTIIPQDYDPNRKYPAILFFHHDDTDGAKFIYETKFRAIADREGIVLIGLDSYSQRDAWSYGFEMEGAKPVLDHTASQLCIDRSRIFLLGHGAGSHAVESLSCEPWVTAIATTSYLPSEAKFLCDPLAPRAAIHIAPSETRHVPLDGGPGCLGLGNEILSLAQFELMWTQRNECGNAAFTEEKHLDGQCKSFTTCAAPFVSCRIEGGFGWPGTEPRGARHDLGGCDGTPKNFPSAEVIWAFFARVPPLPDI